MRLPGVLYRHGWGRLLGGVFLMMTHVGRTTGTPRETVAMALPYEREPRAVVVCSAWGAKTEWVRNLRANPALRVEIGSESWVPRHRFLSEDESVAVALEFRRRHPWRLRLFSSILGWGRLDSDHAVREFVRSRPFVLFEPNDASAGTRPA
jgi:deazaflavin-dependent oxidoreductase (nitroreductase family)